MHRRYLMTSSACIHFCIASFTSAQEASSPLITVEQYIRLLEEQRASIRSLLVSYETSAEYDPRIEQNGRLAGLMLSQSDTLAFSEEKRFAKTVSSGLDVANVRIATDRTTVFTGSECRRRENKTFVIQAAKSGYSEINLYTNVLLWPTSEAELASCSGDPAKVHFLPFFLKGGSWIVSSAENSTGAASVRLTNDDDSRSLWLDPARNYAILRYVHKNPIPGESQWECIYSKHAEVIPGAHLPYEIEIRRHVTDLKTDASLGMISSRMKVTSLAANNVPDSLFVLEPQPGETVVDRIHRTIYKHNLQDSKTLERASEEALAYTQRQPATNWLLRYLIPFNVALAIILVGVFWIRARSRQ
ncbi:MAG: hypothetical protein ACK5Q5_06555 [Planctomycetaceae bacterium]